MKNKTLLFVLLISVLMSGCYDDIFDLLTGRGLIPDTSELSPQPVADCFVDLTPNDGFTSENYFNSIRFKAALKNLEPASPAETFSVPKPDFLTNRSPFVEVTGWVSTCEFAFEEDDYSRVLNAVTSAAAAYSNLEKSYHKESLPWLESISGYSKPGEYYLIPIFIENGKIWLKVDREVDRPGRYGSNFYTAKAYWMTGYEKETGGDVS